MARLGGDEFAVLLEGELNEANLLRLRSQLEASLYMPIELGIATVKVGVAIGYGMLSGSGKKTADVLHRADLAMYARKAELKALQREAARQPETAC